MNVVKIISSLKQRKINLEAITCNTGKAYAKLVQKFKTKVYNRIVY